MDFFLSELNLPLLQENVGFSVDTDQNRWALSLPKYRVCIAIEPNMVACEPKKILFTFHSRFLKIVQKILIRYCF